MRLGSLHQPDRIFNNESTVDIKSSNALTYGQIFLDKCFHVVVVQVISFNFDIYLVQ